MKNEEIKYFSMFTGVGGFELGIGEIGLCIGFSENDKFCNEFLKQRYPEIPNYGDATKIKPEELPDFDILCGGFPCQAFSVAGKRRGFEDTRGTLFFDIARILKIKRPKIVLLENVKGLLNHEKGKTFRTIIQTLSELGYDVQWMVLNSKFFGVPQNRERVFIIGSFRTESRPEILPFRQSNNETSDKENPGQTSNTIVASYYKGEKGTHIQQLNQPKHSNDRIYGDISPTLNTAQGGRRQPMIQRTPLKFMNRNQKNIEGDWSFTIDSANTGGIKEGMKIRRLTPLECERLQGFPDGWTEGFSDTQRYKMMGNAVTVNVVKEVIRRIYEF